jgi:hypothetical protein
MFRTTKLATRALVLLGAGLTLAACYQSDARVFETGVSVPLPSAVACDFDGITRTYDVAAGDGAYVLTDDDGASVDAVFVRSVNPFVYVVQLSDANSVYYTTANILSWRLTKMKEEIAPIVASLAAAHGVTATGGFPTKISGDDADMRAFLRTAADLGSETMATCKPAK